MKLGLIADIHGDSVALRQALDLLHAHAVDHVLCAGDLVNKGADAEGVLRLLEAESIPSVQGNHDLDAYRDGFLLVYASERDGITAAYTGGVPDAMAAYLNGLPRTLDFEWEHQRVYVTHATPWDQVTRMSPQAAPELFQRVASEADAPFVIVGHTHEPMIVTVGSRRIINPGCVYYGYPEFRSTCAILNLPGGACTFLDVQSGAEIEPARVNL